MSKEYNNIEVSKYSELSSDEQTAIHEMLISYVRTDHFYNIVLLHDSEPYDLVKLVSISFENQDAAIWVHFETITGERLTMPLDFISRIELCNHEELLNSAKLGRYEFV